jgi:hypothetical protein
LETGSRVDVYLFYSFDLVESSRLKAQKFAQFNWVELFQYFHGVCRRLMAARGVEHAVVWKYLGDEILFYQRIGDALEVEQTIRAIDRTLSALTQELAASEKYGAAAEYISFRAIAWLAPVLSTSHDITAKMAKLMAQLQDLKLVPEDQMIHDRENHIVDFLGPKTDAGFQLAAAARPERITISAEIADFLRGSDRPVLDAIIDAGA